MTHRDGHPSRFTLDRYALGASDETEIETHVRGCEPCARHVAQVQQMLPVPNWVHELRGSSTPRPRFMASWLAWGSGAAVATAVALVVLVRQPVDTTEVGYTTLRGAPSIGLYIKRGPRVLLWDGQSPVEPGDRLRLKIVPEGFRYVAVFTSPSSAAARVRSNEKPLYASRLKPNVENLLPVAWEVDEEPGYEELTVVLGKTPPRRSDLERALQRKKAPADQQKLWARALRIPKQVPKR